jgi:hypothetical protein
LPWFVNLAVEAAFLANRMHLTDGLHPRSYGTLLLARKTTGANPAGKLQGQRAVL